MKKGFRKAVKWSLFFVYSQEIVFLKIREIIVADHG
jgi:hypothetical protein